MPDIPKKIGHFRIEGPIASGGMGEVYRGFDEMLNRPVAIKRVRSRYLEDDEVGQRLLQEARSAAVLRHPAIVEIFQVLKEEGDLFIVMELVEGRNLAELIREEGPLSPARAVELFLQIVSGLAAAHESGIVHRDIKAQNLMITPEGRAKILDFGLAKDVKSTEASLTATGKIMGTAHTMSPEQTRGERVDPRSDLFSLGVVLYEVLAGTSPFKAGNVTTTLINVCTKNPPTLRHLDPSIPPGLSTLVVDLLQKLPEKRPQTAHEVIAQLEAKDESGLSTLLGGGYHPVKNEDEDTLEPQDAAAGFAGDDLSSTSVDLSPPTTQAAEVREATRSGRRGWILGLVLTAVALLWIWFGLREKQPALPKVAVLGVETHAELSTGESTILWQGAALTRLLQLWLQAGMDLHLVASSEVLLARRDLPWIKEAPTRDELLAMATRLGADFLVWGQVEPFDQELGNLVQLEVLLYRPDGHLLTRETSTGSWSGGNSLMRLSESSAGKLRGYLKLPPLTTSQSLASKGAYPSKEEAQISFWRGVRQLQDRHAPAALVNLQQAADLEDHPAIHLSTWRAHLDLNQKPAALEAISRAKKSMDRLTAFPDLTRKLTQARYFAANGEWGLAKQSFEGLVDGYPSGRAVMFELVEALIQVQNLDQAEVILRDLALSDGIMAEDPRIPLGLSRVAYERSRLKEALQYAAEALTAARKISARKLEAEAMLRQVTAMQRLGDHQAAGSVLQQAAKIFEDMGDFNGQARSLEIRGHSANDQGDLSAAMENFTLAKQKYLMANNRAMAAAIDSHIGGLMYLRGNVAGCVEVLEPAIQNLAGHSDSGPRAFALNTLGACLTGQRQWQRALNAYTQALDLLAEDPAGQALALSNMGEIWFYRGDLNRSLKLHREALSLNESVNDPSGVAYDSLRIAKALRALGNNEPAEDKIRRARSIYEELKDPLGRLESVVELAWLTFQSGDPAEALNLLDQGIQADGEDSDEPAEGVILRAQILLSLGRAQELEAIRPKLASIEDGPNRLAGLWAAMVHTKIGLVQSEDRAAAKESLKQLADSAKQDGFTEVWLEIELARATVALASDRPKKAEALLTSVIQEARERGYVWIQSQAESKRNSTPFAP